MSAPRLSIVIPVLNGSETLPATLAAVAGATTQECLVVDGGSRDDSVAVAKRGGARVLSSAAGRGRQLAAGAAAARGNWLLFLHADTLLRPGWRQAADAFMQRAAGRDMAACFRLRLDDTDPRARRIERLAGWRARLLALPYGDQGLLISRRFYDRLGGFRPIALMEDVDLVRRIGRRRLVLLEAEAETSARRYRRDGWWLRPARNLALLGLYFLGAPPRLLQRFYG